MKEISHGKRRKRFQQERRKNIERLEGQGRTYFVRETFGTEGASQQRQKADIGRRPGRSRPESFEEIISIARFGQESDRTREKGRRPQGGEKRSPFRGEEGDFRIETEKGQSCEGSFTPRVGITARPEGPHDPARVGPRSIEARGNVLTDEREGTVRFEEVGCTPSAGHRFRIHQP